MIRFFKLTRLRGVESVLFSSGDVSVEIYEYGNQKSNLLLVQMIDERDLALMDREVELIREYSPRDFRLMAFKVDDWNKQLSPWCAPRVFGKEDFGCGGGETLQSVLQYIEGKGERYVIGGYSLSALFALWASFECPVFSSVAAASPSIWFPSFLDYMKAHDCNSESVYLSLGDREEKTKNSVMSSVGRCIREAEKILREKGVDTVLEWNEGNHFKDSEKRTARAFASVIR